MFANRNIYIYIYIYILGFHVFFNNMHCANRTTFDVLQTLVASECSDMVSTTAQRCDVFSGRPPLGCVCFRISGVCIVVSSKPTNSSNVLAPWEGHSFCGFGIVDGRGTYRTANATYSFRSNAACFGGTRLSARSGCGQIRLMLQERGCCLISPALWVDILPVRHHAT